MAVKVETLKNMSPPSAMDFNITKLGHVVLQVSDLEKSTAFYTQVLGFRVSDVYPDEMSPAEWSSFVAGRITTAWLSSVPEMEQTPTASCTTLRLKYRHSPKC